MTKYQLTTLWTTLCYTILWSAVSANTEFELQCSPQQMEAIYGAKVILHCTRKPPDNVMDIRVEWLYNDTDDVHIWRHGDDYLNEQKKEFVGKTNLSREELSKGNCSLSLSASISGKYSCFVTEGEVTHNCSISVTVCAQGDKTCGRSSEKLNIGTTPSPKSDTTTGGYNIGAIVGGVVGGAVLIAAVVGIIIICWKQPPVQEGGDRQDEGRPSEQAVTDNLLPNNDGQNAGNSADQGEVEELHDLPPDSQCTPPMRGITNPKKRLLSESHAPSSSDDENLSSSSGKETTPT